MLVRMKNPYPAGDPPVRRLLINLAQILIWWLSIAKGNMETLFGGIWVGLYDAAGIVGSVISMMVGGQLGDKLVLNSHSTHFKNRCIKVQPFNEAASDSTSERGMYVFPSTPAPSPRTPQ